MSHVKKMFGYEIHSNVPLTESLCKKFNPHIGLLMKPFIRQYYFKVSIQKEWGMTQAQCYNRCIEHDIMAFGLSVTHNKYVVLSVIEHRASLNFQKYYHIYKPTKKQNNVLLMFPFTMILKLFVSTSVCVFCHTSNVYNIGSRAFCINEKCTQSKLVITPRDLLFGEVILTFDDIINYKYNSCCIIDAQKMKCKHCRTNKVHKICSYDRLSKKIKSIRDQILNSP